MQGIKAGNRSAYLLLYLCERAVSPTKVTVPRTRTTKVNNDYVSWESESSDGQIVSVSDSEYSEEFDEESAEEFDLYNDEELSNNNSSAVGEVTPETNSAGKCLFLVTFYILMQCFSKEEGSGRGLEKRWQDI